MNSRPIPHAWEKRHLTPLKWNNSVCLQVGEIMKTLMEYANFGQSASTCPPYPFQPRDWVNLGTWKTSLQDQLTPRWSRSHLVIWTTDSALKLQQVVPWVLCIQVKSIPISRETTGSKEPPWLPSLPWSLSSEKQLKCWTERFRPQQWACVSGHTFPYGQKT